VTVKAMSEAPVDAYISEDIKGLDVVITPAAGAACERCWIHSEELDENGLCPRCAAVMAAKA
jgi:isoleucyl-tRNA synthetase